MNRVSRYVVISITTLVIVTLIITLFFSLQNSGKSINPGALSREFPLVITTDNPKELSTIVSSYSDLKGLLPATEIASYQPLLEVIFENKTTDKSVAWVFNSDSIATSAIIISATNVNLPGQKESLTRLNPSQESGNIQIGETQWKVLAAEQYYIFAKDNFTLNRVSEKLKHNRQWDKYGQVLDGVNIFASGNIPGITKNNRDTLLQFNLIQYKDKLYFNTISTDEETVNSLLAESVPSSGNLSDPQPFPGNNKCQIRATNVNGKKLLALEHSKGGSNRVSNPSETINPTATKNLFAALDQPVAKGPFSVENHLTGEKNIIVFDIANQMYLYDMEGKLIWRKTFPDKILGKVFQVDKYNNGKYQYLWNSADKIHLIDITGNEVEGFPFSIPGGTSEGVSMIHFKGYTFPNILLINRKSKLYNINLSPAIVPDWKLQTINFTVSEPIKYLYRDSDHYVIVAGDNGEVIMVNKTGNTRMRIKSSFTNNPLSDFYFNETNSKGNLITTDIYGNLIYIPKFGNVKKTVFGTFPKSHFFFYEDFDLDKNHDFFFIDGNKVNVFNRFKRIILEFSTSAPIKIKPQIIKKDRQIIIGIINSQTALLELYDKNGKSDEIIPCCCDYFYDRKTNRLFSALGTKIYSTKLN